MDAPTRAICLRVTARTFAAEQGVRFLDRAGWHTATTLRVPRSLTLGPLPARRPDLHPVESLGKHIREHYFGQKALNALEEVETRRCRAFQALGEHPEVVQALCGYGWIQTPSAGAPSPDSLASAPPGTSRAKPG